MDSATAAELKTLLVGIPLPAEKPDLLEYAVQQHAEPSLLESLQTLSDQKQYESLDDVVEELLHIQPGGVPARPEEPHEESGLPPGGDDYTNPDPQPGDVADKAS